MNTDSNEVLWRSKRPVPIDDSDARLEWLPHWLMLEVVDLEGVTCALTVALVSLLDGREISDSGECLKRLIHPWFSSFGRQVAVVASGTAAAQLIPIVATPILTRLYSPDDIGKLGLYTAFISFAANGLTLSYSQAIVSGRTEDESASLSIISGLVLIPMSVLGGILFLILASQGWLGFDELPLWTAGAMYVSLILTGIFFVLRYWLVRGEAYEIVSKGTVSQSIGRVATQIIGGVVGFQWLGLVLGEIIGRGAGLTRLWRGARPALEFAMRSFTVEKMRRVAWLYRKFPLVATPSSLLNSLSLVLPVPLITAYFGLQTAGQFAIASRIMVVPLSVIGGAIGDVFHSRIARISRQTPESAMPFLAMVVTGLFATGLVPAIVVTFWGETVFSLVLGEEWREAGLIAASIAPWILMQFTVNPVSRLVQVYQGQELKLVYDALSLLSVIGILTLGRFKELSLIETTTLLGWSQAFVYGVYLCLMVRILRKNRMINIAPQES